MEKEVTIKVKMSPRVVAELKYLIELNQLMPDSFVPGTVEELISQVMIAVADGSRRPGAWEREVISMLGLVADCPEHNEYRPVYGRPEDGG